MAVKTKRDIPLQLSRRDIIGSLSPIAYNNECEITALNYVALFKRLQCYVACNGSSIAFILDPSIKKPKVKKGEDPCLHASQLFAPTFIGSRGKPVRLKVLEDSLKPEMAEDYPDVQMYCVVPLGVPSAYAVEDYKKLTRNAEIKKHKGNVGIPIGKATVLAKDFMQLVRTCYHYYGAVDMLLYMFVHPDTNVKVIYLEYENWFGILSYETITTKIK